MAWVSGYERKEEGADMAKGLSGFPEWLPEHELVQQHLIAIVRRKYELYGFTPVETRSMERLEDLLSKGGDTDKEMYVVSRLAADPAAGADDTSQMGLHYDLTVPFARYVAENQGHLVFPFRRYQIQRAWRGERPQLGRYREFIQADVDVIGRGGIPLRYDVEVLEILRDTLDSMPVPAVKLLVNHRKLLEGFYRGLGIADIAGTLRLVDKLPKLGAQRTRAALVEGGVAQEQADACLALARMECRTVEDLGRVERLGVKHDLLDVGLEELSTLLARVRNVGRTTVVGALHIARGFDYYTGMVVEGVFEAHPELGAVCSGGRYDNLVSGGGNVALPGVGVSIGITRIMAYCKHLGLLRQTRRTPAVVLVIVHSEESRSGSDAVAARLRARSIACVVSDSAGPYGKQIRAAERLGIPYVWFPDLKSGRNEVRDIQSGAQAPVDIEQWVPGPAGQQLGVTS